MRNWEIANEKLTVWISNNWNNFHENIIFIPGSQDSQVVLSVLDDVKRIKVNNKKEGHTNGHANGAVLQQPTGLYPHLSDIETDNSHSQEEYSDCGGSRCGHYTLECVFFFLCIWIDFAGLLGSLEAERRCCWEYWTVLGRFCL